MSNQAVNIALELAERGIKSLNRRVQRDEILQNVTYRHLDRYMLKFPEFQ